MNTIGLVGVPLLTFAVGVFVGFRWCAISYRELLHRLRRTQAVDRVNYFAVLRRDIANVLMRRNHRDFVALKERCLKEASRIRGLSHADAVGEISALSERYMNYEDFDPFHTRDHIFLTDAANVYSTEDLAGRYADIIAFTALRYRIDEDWEGELIGFPSPADVEHAKQYCNRIEDTQFHMRLAEAINQYFIYRDDDNPEPFRGRDFSVQRVHHFAENRYGVTFNDTGEFGLYVFFIDDDRGRTYETYYRSNATFEAEGYLDVLHDAGISLADSRRTT